MCRGHILTSVSSTCLFAIVRADVEVLLPERWRGSCVLPAARRERHEHQ